MIAGAAPPQLRAGHRTFPILALLAFTLAATAFYGYSVRRNLHAEWTAAAGALADRSAAGLEAHLAHYHTISETIERAYWRDMAGGRGGGQMPDVGVLLEDFVAADVQLRRIVVADIEGRVAASSDPAVVLRIRSPYVSPPAQGSQISINGWVFENDGREPLLHMSHALDDGAGSRIGTAHLLVTGERIKALVPPDADRKFFVYLVQGSSTVILGTAPDAEPGRSGAAILLAEAERQAVAGWTRGGDAFAGVRRRLPDLDSAVTVVALANLGAVDRDVLLPRFLPVLAAALALAGGLSVLAVLGHRADRAEGARARAAEVRRQLIESVFTTTRECIVVVRPDQMIAAVNAACEPMLGWRPDELVGRPLSTIIPDASRARHSKLVAQFFGKAERSAVMGDFRNVGALRRDGTSVPIMATLGHFTSGGDAYALAVLRDMTENARSQDELHAMARRLTEQLAAANAGNASKNRFLTNMSHELRTPLNAIIGFSKMIKDQMLGAVGNPRYVEYAADIEASGERLLRTFDKVLDLARLESNTFEVRVGPANIVHAGAAEIETGRALGTPAGVRIEADLPAAPVIVSGDLVAMRRCIGAVIENAVQASPVDSVVRCRLEESGSFVRISVADEGRGISAADMKRIGTAFERGGDVYRADSQGAGIGLAVTRRLMELMGGQLELWSEQGKGTRVVLAFRKLVPAAPVRQRE